MLSGFFKGMLSVRFAVMFQPVSPFMLFRESRNDTEMASWKENDTKDFIQVATRIRDRWQWQISVRCTYLAFYSSKNLGASKLDAPNITPQYSHHPIWVTTHVYVFV